MAGFYLTPKSVPSSAGKAASGVMSRMSKNAGHDSATKSGKGHFAAAAQKIAKKRSGHLQHGVPKHAPTGASNIGGSKVPANSKKVHASEAQTALNPQQQGKSFKKAQTDGYDDDEV